MKLFVFCLTLTLAMSVFSLPFNKSEEEEWNAYKSKYGKHYATKEEDQLRMNIYFDNIKHITKHNNLYDNGIKTYKLGINKFADLTSREFSKLMTGYKGAIKQTGKLYVAPANEQLPSSVDWRQKGAVTPVKNQGQCGSSWAFVTTGAIEGQHFLKTGKLVSLSEQNLMDCSKDLGNEPCNGGYVTQAYEYVRQNNGIDTEESYPYTAKDNPVCNFNKSTVGATISGCIGLLRGSEKTLKSAVANIGPVSTGIDTSLKSFHLYHSGVYYERTCSKEELNHGVLVVGYGTEGYRDYWLVKNSWGEDWGMGGYIKMARNRKNNCGIATDATYPIGVTEV